MSIILEVLAKKQQENQNAAAIKEPLASRLDLSVSEKKNISNALVRLSNAKLWKIVFIIILSLVAGNLILFSCWVRQKTVKISANITAFQEHPGNLTPPPRLNFIAHKESIAAPDSPLIVSAPGEDIPLLKVTGIVWDEKNPIAIINGKILSKGDKILGAEIVEIELDKVNFLYQDKKISVSIS